MNTYMTFGGFKEVKKNILTALYQAMSKALQKKYRERMLQPMAGMGVTQIIQKNPQNKFM